MRVFKLRSCVLLILAVFFVAGSPANAALIPYPNSGFLNPTVYSFVASSTGNVTAYFYGAVAGNTSKIQMLVNNVLVGSPGLQNNPNPAYGTSHVLGAANAGDLITFVLLGVSHPANTFYSDPTLNSDLLNHIYSTAWLTDGIIPNGVYVGFEDLPQGGDKDYNDLQFVFTNVSEKVPEPTSIAIILMMLVSTAGLMAARRLNRS